MIIFNEEANITWKCESPSVIHYDEGLMFKTSAFKSFTVANLPYRYFTLVFYFPTDAAHSFFWN